MCDTLVAFQPIPYRISHMQKGDIILSINGVPSFGKTYDEAVQILENI